MINDMQNRIVKGSKRARIAAILLMIGLGTSAFLIDIGSAPSLAHPGLITLGLPLGACMLAFTSAYCFYLAVGAFQSKQIPSPNAFVPTDCIARSGAFAVVGGICLAAINGVGLMAAAIWIVAQTVTP